MTRFDVVDRSFRVMMRGSGQRDLAPVADCMLEPKLARELSYVLTNDFAKRPVATGLFETYAWRAVSLGEGDHFGLLLEENGLAQRIERFAATRGLGAADASLLRLIVGGYPYDEISRRTGETHVAVIARRSRLMRALGCPRPRDLVDVVAGVPRQQLGRAASG